MSALSVTMEDGVAVITFDLAGESVNKFTRGVIDEFDALISRFAHDDSVRAAVLMSGKPDGFIAGADIDAFLEFRTAQDATIASAYGHRMMDRLEHSRVPIVVAIHGACLGGGLEAALACAYRIATEHPRTVFALPETQLGLIPGAGGTQRLPRTVGLQAALDIILTAKNVRARKALQTGLIDELVHPSILRTVAVQRAKELAAGTLEGHQERRHGAMALVLEDNPLGRAVVFRQAREQTLRKSRGNYPALTAAIEAVQAGYHGDRAHGFAEEARLFGEMAMTDVSRELVFLFYATTSLKKHIGGPGEDAVPLATDRIAVLGAGFMGAGIAAVAATQGIPVRLKDTKHDAVGRGLAAVRDVLKERLTKRQITRQQFDDQLSLVAGTVEYTGFHAPGLVIEAVYEDLAVKHAVLADVEPLLAPHAIFASNTSTIPIARIAERSARPERVIGMHFFSPVHKMPLVEVITTPRTAPEVVATTVAFGRRLGKTVIVVQDSPGFYVNRILAPYITEAGRLLDEGVAVDAIDAALLAFGFPVGPITLLDEVGLDIASKSGAIMTAAFGERLQPSPAMARLIADGRLGRKARRGFYRYDDAGKKGEVDDTVYAILPAGTRRVDVPADEIQWRCVLGMVNEAMRCLEEGIVHVPRDADIGAVFGIGFPPFRGGPLRYVDAMGPSALVEQLERLNARYPGRFAPCALLMAMARNGSRFYPAAGKPV